jgi:hypothetical protein
MAAGLGLAGFLALARVRLARRTPPGFAGRGIFLCLAACGVTMVLAVIAMTMRVGSPIETAGEAIFTTHGGELQGPHARIRVPLPAGWRFRYGRQAWREGTLIDERGRHVLRLAVSIASRSTFGDPGAKGRLRAGPRGPQWVIDVVPGPSRPHGTQIAEEWGPEILYVLVSVLPAGADLDPAAMADRLSRAAEIPARGK